MSAPADEVSRLMEAAGPDGTFRLPVSGRSLSPLLRPGDSIDLRRCDAGALRPGDLALVRRGRVWSARVVVGVRPLRTAFLREHPADEPGDVHARVVVAWRGVRAIPYRAAMRALARSLHRVLGGRAYAALRPLAARLRDAAPARALRARRLGSPHLRRLHPGDAEALDRYAAEHLPRARELLARQIGGSWAAAGVALGAFDARGRLVAFVFLDEYAQEDVDLPGWWVRLLSTSPAARRLGLGRAMVRELCAHAEARGLGPVRADVSVDNEPSLRLFRSLGFREASPELTARANRVLDPPVSGSRWIVMEHTPGSTPEAGDAVP